jgi:predicted glycoside hydrolase/deacetylase ChbG (UPF0249 family)
MVRYLIVNSDDFGISEGVSRGIIDGHLNGIVTSTTTMINMPAAEAAIQQAQRNAPKLGLGLHLNLSFGKPVCAPEDVPSLVTDAGDFGSTADELRARIPHFTGEDLNRELTAQFDRFTAIAGRLPTHIDSHHGSTYFHPAAFDVMLRLAQENGLPIRWSDDFPVPNPAIKQFTAEAIAKHGAPRKTDHFADFIFDFGSVSRIQRLKDGLATIQDGYTELMVHVGYGEGLAEDYNVQRDEELAAVTDAGVMQVIAAQGIRLVNFDDLP